jgi:hypothetical protein
VVGSEVEMEVGAVQHFCLEVEIDSPDMWGMWAIEVEIEVQWCDQP